MSDRQTAQKIIVIVSLLMGTFVLLVGCKSTKHLKEDQYLLIKNKVNIKSQGKLTNRVEIRENLNKLIIQKPNSNAFDIMPFRTPLKLWRYNHRYRKLHNRPDTLLPKSVERPVILDTQLIQITAQRMKTDLFRRGFFYAKVRDTVVMSHNKASVTYNVETGINYIINSVKYFIDDSELKKIVSNNESESLLEKGREYTYTLAGDERSRLTNVIRNNGYYKFTLDNINIVLDTVDKAVFKDIEDPFAKAINFVSNAKKNSKPTLDVEIHIHESDDLNGFIRYHLNQVNIYPDYISARDLVDTTLINKEIDSIQFWYHRYYLHPKVLYEHIYIAPGEYFSQENLDKTQVKLTQLGVFQYTRLVPHDNPVHPGVIDYDILLVRSKKYDFSTLYELSSGSTYALGHSIGVNFRDKNFMKGANLLTIGINGGLELSYNSKQAGDFLNKFSRLTNYYGINASIDFPKFLAPIASSLFDNSNLPHTIIGGGRNVIDRINYFTLVNTSANFSYSWRESQTKTWTLSPAFVNVIALPVETDSFKKVLVNNAYLRNSYKENFIEGENITFTFDNISKKHSINYSYLKLSLEEAGTILGGLNKVVDAVNDLYTLNYAQYAKFDFDARQYFTLPHSVFAFRLYGGVGLPYGSSATLPYIKQYFSGGPYSLRGWRIRTLGPGNYFDTTAGDKSNQIDRTGDIKLELNGEFRFPITMLFSGAIKMNGAIFADAGNIWLAHKDPSYPGGEFEFNTLGKAVAADMGIGTRFDIASFLTFRIDVAMPVKKPYVSANDGWVFKQINFNNSTWRSDNIVLNVSIGYPF